MKEKRPTFQGYKKKAFKSRKFETEYNKLEFEFDLAEQLILARKKAKLSQKQLALVFHTKQPAIARYEHGGYAKSSLERLGAYVEALGFQLDIKIVPINGSKKSSHCRQDQS